MTWLVRYARSSIGAKHIMAVTGLLLLLFAIFHMIGHLQMFGGQEVYNAYAHLLQNLWEVKWPARAGLLALLVTHVVVVTREISSSSWIAEMPAPTMMTCLPTNSAADR